MTEEGYRLAETRTAKHSNLGILAESYTIIAPKLQRKFTPTVRQVAKYAARVDMVF